MFKTMLLVLATGFTLLAQEQPPKSGWQKELTSNLNFTQNNFDNWQQGGENAWAWQLNFNGSFVFVQPGYEWANTMKIAYGKTRVGDAQAKKSSDEIRLESVYTRKLSRFLNPFVSLTALSQFTTGYEYTQSGRTAISAFLDPGYFTESIGLGYAPNEHLKTRFGAAIKQTVTQKYEQRYGQGKELFVEYGANSVTDIGFKLAQNILYSGKLEMFSNLKRINEIDVNWDNLLSSQITKFVTLTFNVKLYYDRDVSKKRQLQQVLAVGLTYNFF